MKNYNIKFGPNSYDMILLESDDFDRLKTASFFINENKI
jgi:hypothetical protein